MRIDCAEHIVEEVDIAVLVDGTGELDALLLPAAEVDATLADLRLVAKLHHLQVLLQAAHPDDLLVPLPVHGLPEEDVLLDGAVLNPCRLRDVRRAATHLHLQSFAATDEASVSPLWKYEAGLLSQGLNSSFSFLQLLKTDKAK